MAPDPERRARKTKSRRFRRAYARARAELLFPAAPPTVTTGGSSTSSTSSTGSSAPGSGATSAPSTAVLSASWTDGPDTVDWGNWGTGTPWVDDSNPYVSQSGAGWGDGGGWDMTLWVGHSTGNWGFVSPSVESGDASQ
ncbi:hypothetical protein B0H11DRAFT_2264649 [Mycena galericulata]|nr:hypothetical protein B0H11DRAFT_2264649 [Mycena galericulata]